MDKSRPSNPHNVDREQPDPQRCMQVLDKMSTIKGPEFFADDYYQKGPGKPLFDAFKEAMIAKYWSGKPGKKKPGRGIPYNEMKKAA
jgi:hypothetical protein